MTKKKIDLNNEIERLLSPEVKQELDKAPPSPAFQQFLVRYLDIRDSVIINFIEDNDEFAKKIANSVYGQFAQTFKTYSELLERIEKGQKEIAKRLDVAEEKVNIEEARLDVIDARLDKKKKDIEELKENFHKHKESVEILAEIKPTLQTIQTAFRFWSWKNWWKIAGVFIGIIFLIVGLLVGVVFYLHAKGWVTQNKATKQSYDMQATYDTKIRTAPVRSIHYNKLTEVQRDSIITENQEGILKSIEQRTKEYNEKYKK